MSNYKESEERLIDDKLIGLLGTKTWPNNYMVKSFIEMLFRCKVLNKMEIQLCKAVLEKIELLNTYDIQQVLDELGHSITVKDNIEIKDVQYEANKYIDKRFNQHKREELAQIGQLLNDKVVNRVYTKLLLDRYAQTIQINKESTLEDYLNSFDETAKNDLDKMISTSCECIDRFLNGGLKGGQLTTILGDDSPARSLWCLNIAYKAITTGKNVLYLTLGTLEKELMKKLMLRHSFDTKFEKELTLNEDAEETYDAELIKIVCNDFYDNLAKHLRIFDDSFFDICTTYSLQKLLVDAEYKFKDSTGRGIDLIIIDSFNYMKLDNGVKKVTSMKTISDEYYTFLRENSKDFLKTNKMIPIVVSMAINEKYNDSFHEGSKMLRYCIPDRINILSDNILAVRSNNRLLDVMVVQTNDGEVMDYYDKVYGYPENWFISYNKEDIVFKTRLTGLSPEEISEDSKMIVDKLLNSKQDFFDTQLPKYVFKDRYTKEEMLNG